MAVNLLTPILSTRARSINFFNGRLLAGEDLTTEQQTNRVAHTLLGNAIGDGVVYGLDVAESRQSSTPAAPVLTITQGLAFNKNGAALLLDNDTEVGLVRPANGSTGTVANIFEDCTPAESGPYIAGAGVYLLTVGPANASQGLAAVSGTDTTQAPCNSKYNVQGVQFRLVAIDAKLIGLPDFSDVARLRNYVAYQCFGVADWNSWRDAAFDMPGQQFGVIDALRSRQLLTGCEVPLAVLFWTADGLQFVDRWAVRRRIARSAATQDWPLLIGDRRVSEGEAMFLQFQDQLAEIRMNETDLPMVVAGDRFIYLPSIGVLPLTGPAGAPGFSYQTFFSGQAYHKPIYVEAALIQPIVRTALSYDPVNLSNREAIRIYEIVERGQVLPYVIFTSIYVPIEGEARFDVSAWNFSDFSLA
jgi:hypothetical protein